MPENFVVTPWKVEGKVDYAALIKEFGTKPLTEELVNGIVRQAGKDHLFLRRKLFFSHRDFDVILKKFKTGEKFALYTGRGPSGKTHIGHLVPWIFCKYLQDAFDAELYFQMTDDEKFLIKPELSLKQTLDFTYDNALDVIACGFDPKKTFIFADTEYIKSLYKIALEVSKKTTFSTAKAVFGFENESNTGIIFFPSIQAAPCFLPSELKGKKIPVLIPAAIDQDPYWRITRDIAEKLGYYKPAQLHCMFLPGLGEGGKMSASDPNSSIFTTDSPKEVSKKIASAFTGGQATVEEQRKKGANPDVCSVFKYWYYLFEEADKKLGERETACRTGKLLCGECKKQLAEKVNKFLAEHQAKREQAKDKLREFMLKG